MSNGRSKTAKCVSAIDGSRIRNGSSFLSADCDGDEATEERLDRLESLRLILVAACGGEDAYAELIARIEDEPADRGASILGRTASKVAGHNELHAAMRALAG
jgi:hypothetical protein